MKKWIDVHENEIEERDVTAEQQHRDDDDQGGIGQLLVALNPFSFGSHGQEAFCSSSFDFGEEIFGFVIMV